MFHNSRDQAGCNDSRELRSLCRFPPLARVTVRPGSYSFAARFRHSRFESSGASWKSSGHFSITVRDCNSGTHPRSIVPRNSFRRGRYKTLVRCSMRTISSNSSDVLPFVVSGVSTGEADAWRAAVEQLNRLARSDQSRRHDFGDVGKPRVHVEGVWVHAEDEIDRFVLSICCKRSARKT